MKALVDASAWSLESGKVLARENRLPTMAATDDCFAFHGVTSRPPLGILVGQLVPDRFQVLVGLLQAGARLVDGSEDGNVVNSDADFGLMFPQEFLNEDGLFSPSLLWRVIGQGIHLPYEVVQGGVANDANAMRPFLPVQKTEIGGGEGNE